MAESKTICGFAFDAVAAEAKRIVALHPELNELDVDMRTYRACKLAVDSLREKKREPLSPREFVIPAWQLTPEWRALNLTALQLKAEAEKRLAAKEGSEPKDPPPPISLR